MSGRLMRKTLGQLPALETVNVETTNGRNDKRTGDRRTMKLNGETPMLDTKLRLITGLQWYMAGDGVAGWT